LKRVLLEQDELIEMIRGLNVPEKPEVCLNKGDQRRIRCELEELERIYGLGPAVGSSDAPIPKYLLHCVKYLRKLQSADPVQLCRLLELPFTAEKPFALADSLLSGMVAYARAEDSEFAAAGDEGRVVRLLVCELIQSKREAFALVQGMIEAGVVGIDEFTEKASEESSCIRVALKGPSPSTLMNLLSKLL
jgi:hypothetical protein